MARNNPTPLPRRERCTKCGRRPRRAPGQRWCKPCFNAYLRAWRAAKQAAQHADERQE